MCTVDRAMAARLHNADPEVETGSSMAACGAAQRPLRKLSVGDLHIRSHEEDPASACREIRAILREIRDSLKCDDSQEKCAVNKHSAGTAAESPKRIHEDVEAQAHTRHTDVELSQRRDPQRSGWRHCRLSLPARLHPGHVDGLTDAELNGVGASRTGRRRVPANVRFADELGMNLNTFAMIPSRQVRDDSPTCVPLPRPRPAASVNHVRPSSPPPHPRPHHVFMNGCRDERVADGQAQELEDELDSASDHQKLEANHEQFKLCFKQPFAELERFRCKLDRQMVCLENVRVDDWTPGAPHHVAASNSWSVPSTSSSAAANSVILCSIQTKNSADRRDAKVFARCTSDNWRTYADLPAQRVTGLDSLGLGYERYCFAVRRPVTPDPCTSSPCNHHCDAGMYRPSAAVEFAVCYQMTADCTYWDNNDDTNYRIEWFQKVT